MHARVGNMYYVYTTDTTRNDDDDEKGKYERICTHSCGVNIRDIDLFKNIKTGNIPGYSSYKPKNKSLFQFHVQIYNFYLRDNKIRLILVCERVAETIFHFSEPWENFFFWMLVLLSNFCAFKKYRAFWIYIPVWEFFYFHFREIKQE